ncbi:MAG: acyl-CoA dehydratase activase-related protein [Bacillota bacterium]
MTVGIPKGLLFHKYGPFFRTFFEELGEEIVFSGDTTKDILDQGAHYCVDDACLPIKVFHGHVACLKDKCDLMLVPRFMRVRKREYICPKFCGLPEMIINSIPHLPAVTKAPIYAQTGRQFYKWAKETGSQCTKDPANIQRAFKAALAKQSTHGTGIRDEGFGVNVALVGHPYNIYDPYINMNLVRKLNRMGIGVVTEEYLADELIDSEVKKLYKRPFWTFARNAYGFAVHMANRVDGVIYISSFACGIDSVVTELIKLKIGEVPYLVLKIDEHTGEAGFDTRIEAFADMLERRRLYGDYVPAPGKRLYCN